jgi:hypothetical protein
MTKLETRLKVLLRRVEKFTAKTKRADVFSRSDLKERTRLREMAEQLSEAITTHVNKATKA